MGKAFLGLLLALAGLTITAQAQTTQTVTVSSTVPQVLAMTLGTSSVSIPFLSSDYNASTGLATKAVTTASSFAVSSNKNWTVNVKASGTAFTFTPSAGDTDPSKPAGDLGYKLSTGGTYTAITASNVVLKTGNKGGTATSGNSFSVDYQLNSNLATDPPGTYSLAVVYTLTAP